MIVAGHAANVNRASACVLATVVSNSIDNMEICNVMAFSFTETAQGVKDTLHNTTLSAGFALANPP